MNILNPPALLFALLAIPILLLYLLRLKRREQTVSSTLLWRQALMDREANTLWQRLRRSLLLLLQLLTLAFLVFALLRPTISAPGGPTGRQIVLLDASASMMADDVAPSRFEAAKAQARALVDRLAADDSMTILLVDGAPRALAGDTADKAALRAALDGAQPSLQAANWPAALALAAGAAGQDAPAVTVISDGANAGSADRPQFGLLAGDTRFITVGADGDNLSISALSLRRSSGGLAALVRVANTGTQEREALVSLRADAQLVDARALRIPANESVAWTVSGLPPGAAVIQASLAAAQGNHLAVDDAAYAVNTDRRDRRALLLSPGNLFLEQALAALPELQVTRVLTPPAAGEILPAFDLYVLDGITMPLPSGANALYLLPALPASVTDTGSFTNTAHARSEAHPILQAVDWRAVSVMRASRLDAPAWLRPIVHSQGGPLLFAGEPSGADPAAPTGFSSPAGRTVVVPFDLSDSDLPLQIAFPVLMANTVEWLAPPQGSSIPATMPPGEAVALPQDTQVELPDGAVVVAGPRGFAATDQLGVYRGVYRGASTLFAVNFSDPGESDITPGAMSISRDAPPPDAEASPLSQQEIWGWLAALALAALMLEWWVYQRGLPFGRR